MVIIPHQIEFKKYKQIEILELKSTVSKIQNLLEVFESKFELTE